MARSDRSPSKWWFWGIPALANAYLLLLLIFGFIAGWLPPWCQKDVADVLLIPLRLSLLVVEPVLESVESMSLRVAVAATLGVWEALVFAIGLVCYGAAFLVCAIVPGEPRSGGAEWGQSQG